MLTGRPPRFVPDRKGKERPSHPTRHMWTLWRGSDSRTCEIYEDKAHAGWDVKTFDNGWLSYAHRVASQAEATQVADLLREDCIREGWNDHEPQAP